MSKKKEIISLIIGFMGTVAGLYGVVVFNQFVMMSLSLGTMYLYFQYQQQRKEYSLL